MILVVEGKIVLRKPVTSYIIKVYVYTDGGSI
jgi:hypothetical protein